MTFLLFKSLLKLRSMSTADPSCSRWEKKYRANWDHVKLLLFNRIVPAVCFTYSLCCCGTSRYPMTIFFFLSGIKLQLSFYFYKLRQQFHCKIVRKSSSLLPTPSSFFWKWINKSRVFVCTDQYVVMKAALQFPAKASLAGWAWICFILYCYQPCINVFSSPSHCPLFSSWEHHGLDNHYILWRQIESWRCMVCLQYNKEAELVEG